MDAIEQKIANDPKAKAHISIVFNCRLRSVEVSDTGIGMSAEELREVLAPGKSLKRGAANLRGEKGVGVSFIVFASNRFRIETCDGKQTTSIQIDNANDWIRGSEPKEPQFANVHVGEAQEWRGSKTYTRIWIEEIPAKPDVEEDLFNYTQPRLVHVLRSKTAVGNTFPLFNHDARPAVDIGIELQYVDEKGVKTSPEAVEYTFASPADYLKSSEVITWDAYQSKLIAAKARTLKGKCLVRTGTSTSDTGKEVRWYAMATSRKTYDRISEEFDLRTASANDVEPGIFVATRGMPTGIVLAPPRSQQAAYWPSFFILLEYDAIR